MEDQPLQLPLDPQTQEIRAVERPPARPKNPGGAPADPAPGGDNVKTPPPGPEAPARDVEVEASGPAPRKYPPRVPPPKGYQPPALRRQAEKVKGRSYLNMMEVARLISQEGLKQAEVAERLDCSTRWVSLQWRKFLLLLHQDDLVPEELRRDVRLFAETGLRDLIEKGLLQYEETAAYGAVVLQSIRTLLEMHGAMAPEAGDESEAEVEKVVEDLKVRSPLVRERLERLEAAKKKRQEEMARGRSEGG